jgi:DNA repair protein RadC
MTVLDPDALPAQQLLDLVLGSRDASLGRQLLDRFGTLRRLGRAGLGELLALPGVGRARAERLQAVFGLARRYATDPLPPGRVYRCSDDIYRHFRSTLLDLRKERFLLVLLDGKHRVMGSKTISEGSLTASLVHPREVFSPAIRESAGAVVLVHNHPSGDPTPSLEDIEITRRLIEVGELVGIRVLDHVIIGEDTFTSFLEHGLLRRL